MNGGLTDDGHLVSQLDDAIASQHIELLCLKVSRGEQLDEECRGVGWGFKTPSAVHRERDR